MKGWSSRNISKMEEVHDATRTSLKYLLQVYNFSVGKEEDVVQFVDNMLEKVVAAGVDEGRFLIALPYYYSNDKKESGALPHHPLDKENLSFYRLALTNYEKLGEIGGACVWDYAHWDEELSIPAGDHGYSSRVELEAFDMLFDEIAGIDPLFFVDFESGLLPDWITVERTGNYSDDPGVKETKKINGSKAFGFGRSNCVSNCFERYATSLIVDFSVPKDISGLSFLSREVYSDWGSKSLVLIDGKQVGNSFSSGNDMEEEDQAYPWEYMIDKPVSKIEIRTWDITKSSEVFIDDLKIW